ncbi:ABC transporter ATP-binding protein [Iodidimonas nitroreducens]|uniref:ABC transporter ATP-binding protein n=1 Tax=Iodidimonas nitroreducens TaxID=1236968 RepID=A0A5A7N5D1_9PROT|nr:ABC transporter ATP-binding protein [Iodidimonas nitroreducens]GAK34037.1 ATP-binding cassette sub-family B member 10, mitochondrial [alpha proteobacterium Q-1]GER02865.1 ABC transporter ATP-binding protein [Iodidimonas nitroreducens]
MANHVTDDAAEIRHIWRWMIWLLGPERRFYYAAIILGTVISLLTLAIPISVQMLVDSVANTALVQPVVVLSLSLFGLLSISGGLWAARAYLMEIFSRRIHARLSAEMAMTAIHARTDWFEEARRSDLYDRYFDIMVLQKTVPEILIGGFSIVFQAGIGFVVVSFYHPLFFGLILGYSFIIWLIWMIWGKRGTLGQVQVSHAKYRMAHWLGSLAATNGFYKRRSHVDHALLRTERLGAEYLRAQEQQYSASFAQTISLLALYALASAALLGIGGWLVIENQLTLGQLVAAELILSAAFFGFSQFSVYLDKFYLLAASIEELSQVFSAPLEPNEGTRTIEDRVPDLEFAAVKVNFGGENTAFNFKIAAGTKVVAHKADSRFQRLFTNLLKRHIDPERGHILLAGEDIRQFEIMALRQQIVVLDRPAIIACTIAEYLQLARPSARYEEIEAALQIVGLSHVIASLDEQLDTELLSNGWPLSAAEALQLKLAAALLAQPKILVIGEIYDMLSPDRMSALHTHFASLSQTTVILFSNHHQPSGFSPFLKSDEALSADVQKEQPQ